MRLKEETIDRIRSRRNLRLLICDELNTSRRGLWRYITRNDENGRLTLYNVLRIISNDLKKPIEDLVTEEVNQEVA